MKKIKEFMKSYTLGFVISILLCGTVGVYAATYIESNLITYDNTESGMNSDNVQTAIDELYNTCFPPKAGDQILEDQPLEKDPYECRYFFTGANPNNYITFNNEKAGWRIISVECDGTIKIMKNESIGNQAWDTSGSLGNNNWARPASLNTYLNGTYYNSLNSNAQSQIIAKNFSIGGVTYANTDLEKQVNDENSNKWSGKIALPTSSEYLRTNSNKDCKTFNAYMTNNYEICKNTTWMYISESWWTLSPGPSSGSIVNWIDESARFNSSYANETNTGVRPTLYLSQNIQITGGTGTQADPYEISI